MNNQNGIGYAEEPKNGEGIRRSKTTRQLRAWEFSRSLKSLEIINKEFNNIDFPGIYILFEGKNKVYIGETNSLFQRVKTHTNNPEEKIKNWDAAIIINDGRTASHSEFNDSIIRKELEHFLVRLFNANKYRIVAQSSAQNLNSTQKYSVDSLKTELEFILLKKNRNILALSKSSCFFQFFGNSTVL